MSMGEMNGKFTCDALLTVLVLKVLHFFIHWSEIMTLITVILSY